MGTRENKVERYLASEVARLGGLSRKWVSPGVIGVPDQIVVVDGRVWLVEVKTVDGARSPEQIREHRRLEAAGAQVRTVYGHSGVDALIEEIQRCATEEY